MQEKNSGEKFLFYEVFEYNLCGWSEINYVI